LLHWLFDGKDAKGARYGIYVNKKKKGQGQKIDYFLYGRITGWRTIKGDDINYQGWDEDKTEYKTLIERKLFRGLVTSHLAKRQNRVAPKFYKPPQSPFMKGGRKISPPL